MNFNTMHVMYKFGLTFTFLFFSTTNGRTINNVDTATSNTELNVDDYLQKFGYMEKQDPNKGGDGIAGVAPDRSQSLRVFQEWNHLPVTGELDEATLKLMNTPRCGVPDKPLVTGMANPYVLSSKWAKTLLYYRIYSLTPDMAFNTARQEIARAFKFWTDVANLDIRETTTTAGDIKISFESGDHGDGAPFDGPGGVLAHAAYPADGRCHFDEAEYWVANTTGADLFTIAAHEFGHNLGLAHSADTSALMYPYYAGYVANYAIRADDRAGIIAHYGAKVIITDAPKIPKATTTEIPTTTEELTTTASETTTTAPETTTTAQETTTTSPETTTEQTTTKVSTKYHQSEYTTTYTPTTRAYSTTEMTATPINETTYAYMTSTLTSTQDYTDSSSVSTHAGVNFCLILKLTLLLLVNTVLFKR